MIKSNAQVPEFEKVLVINDSDRFAGIGPLPPLEIKLHKTLVFTDMIAPSFATEFRPSPKSSGWWMPYKVSKGDSVYFAHTRRLHYIEDANLEKFHESYDTYSSLFGKQFSQDLYNMDYKDENPNTQMIYLGFEASIGVGKIKFYKFLDVASCTIKWIQTSELDDKIRHAFSKNLRNKTKQALEKTKTL